MAHTTTCPSCSTTFRVTAAQLLARDGEVRCGRCTRVFNAHQSLSLDYPQAESSAPAPATSLLAAEISATPEFVVEETPPDEPEPHPEETDEPDFRTVDLESEPAPMETPALAAEASVAPEFAVEDTPQDESEPPTEETGEPDFLAVDLESEPEPRPENSTEAEAAYEPACMPEAREEVTAAEISSLPAPEAVPVDEPAPAPEEGSEPPRPGETPGSEASPRRRNFRLAWLAGIALLALGLFLQNAMHFRNELIAQSPGLKPAFEEACGLLGCRVALPQNADLLSIEASSLEAGAGQPGIVVLNAALRNRASYMQAHPLLELTLTDYQDKLVARRIFQPREYLPAQAAAQDGMPANEEIEVKLIIDLGDSKAAGYRVYLFYPSTAS